MIFRLATEVIKIIITGLDVIATPRRRHGRREGAASCHLSPRLPAAACHVALDGRRYHQGSIWSPGVWSDGEEEEEELKYPAG